jgi:hypothetical protein
MLEALFALQGSFTRGFAPPERKFPFGIEAAPFKDNAAAACCISADFEMGWGWRSRGRRGAEQTADLERRNVPLIVALLERYSVPITWATIGHLFLESCPRACDGRAHVEMPRPLGDGSWSGDWYANDPCSNLRDSPHWYAPDLIQQIVESRVPHEIGTHSFSHINFTAACSGAEVVRRELERCAEVMAPWGLQARTLVFPRNRDEYTHLPLLAEAGISVVRHRERKNHVRLSYPERTASGVYKIYESMNLRSSPRYDYLNKVKIFLQRAMAQRAVYSLWFHPSDAVEYFETQLPEILDYMDRERRSGRLWIAPMAEIAAYCEAREQLQLAAERTERSLTLSLRTGLDVSRYGDAALTLILPAPSLPRSGTLRLRDGRSIPARLQVIERDSRRLLVNVPATATQLVVEF